MTKTFSDSSTMKAGSLDIMDPSDVNRIRNKRIDFIKTGLIVVLIVVAIGLAVKVAMKSASNAGGGDAGSNFARPIPTPPFNKVLIQNGHDEKHWAHNIPRNVKMYYFRKRHPRAQPSTAWVPRIGSTPT